MKPTTTNIFATVVVLLILVAGIVYFLAEDISLTAGKVEQRKFNREDWVRAKPNTEDNKRAEMLNDLKNNYLIKGVDSSEVKDLLGEPERQLDFRTILVFMKVALIPRF